MRGWLSGWVLAALAFDVLVAAVDAGIGREALLTGVFVIAPLALAAVETPARVAGVAAVSFFFSVLSGLWNDYFFSGSHLARVAIVFVGGAIAVVVSRARVVAQTRRQEVSLLTGELRSSERRLEAILNSLGEAVTVRGASGRTIYTNDAARRLLGMESQDEIDRRPSGGVAADFVMEDENGRELSMDDLPSTRVLRGEDAEPMLVRSVRRASGEERWILVKSTPLHDERGRVQAAINVLEDVTAVKRNELRTRFLGEVTDLLASSLDYEQTLRNVAGLAVPTIADWCAVDLIDEDGERNSVAVAHRDPTRLALAERLREYEPPELNPEEGIGLVVRTGEPVLYPEIGNEMLVRAAADEQHLALLREVGFRSALIAPMRIGRHTLGVLTLVTAESGRLLDQSDVEFAEQLAARAAVAVENARLYSQRTEVARTLQDSLLPADLPEIPEWEAAALYLPAGLGTEVGGDFYDLWPRGEEWMVVVGDVTGKGIAAAALTALVRHTARTASEYTPEPCQILGQVHRTLFRESSVSLCTALCARLVGARVTLASAGHPLPVCVSGSAVRELGSYGPLLGAFADSGWRETVCHLEPGDMLVAFTDGVTDAIGEDGERFGSERLLDVLRGVDGLAPGEVVAEVRRALTEFQVGAQADDTAVLVLRYVGDRAVAQAPAVRAALSIEH